MISLDSSLIPAIVIFLVLVIALNKILFKPLLQVQAERAKRTSGLMAEIRKQLDNQAELFNRYQAAIRQGRMESYRRQEQMRAEAMQKRAVVLARARGEGERLILDARVSIQDQVQASKAKLESDAREIAGGIAATILRRTA